MLVSIPLTLMTCVYELMEIMFTKALRNPNRVLHRRIRLVSAISRGYSLRLRVHDRALPERLNRL